MHSVFSTHLYTIKTMKVLFVTGQAPFGNGEVFVVEELIELKKSLSKVYICPVNPQILSDLHHGDASQIIDSVIEAPLFSLEIIFSAFKWCIRNPNKISKIVNIITSTRGIDNFKKNLAIVPKALWLSSLINSSDIDHIHAYWGAHTATLAMIVATNLNVKWSFTAYRWDISANNLIHLKSKSATFIRSADMSGINELMELSQLGEQYSSKFKLIRSGVNIDKMFVKEKLIRKEDCDIVGKESVFTFLTPAFFVEKKGHKYLVEAVKILVDKGYIFRCLLVGEGEKKQVIEDLINKFNVESFFHFTGFLSLEDLRGLYLQEKVDIVVLPSIITEDNQKEGIPVSLIDALACGIPIISTNTGGIPELVTDDVGIIVEQKESGLLANAMEYFMTNRHVLHNMSENAVDKIKESYDVKSVAKNLIGNFGEKNKEIN